MGSERNSSSSSSSLSMLFFPLMAQGHILPMLDMAKLFAIRGVETTILTTPANTALLQPSIDRANRALLRHPMRLRLVPFPSDTGLPEGCENLSSIPSQMKPALVDKFFRALARLRGPFEWVLRELLPVDCVITDMFLPWTYDVTAKLGVPRLVFHGISFFSLCVTDSLGRHSPLESLPAEAETLVIPGLPHRIEMLRSKIKDLGELKELFREIAASESKSYGVVVNSFYELEPDYARHYREVVGRRAWHVGPVALCNRDVADMSGRGCEATVGHNDCTKWLDRKSAGSVLYVCFGSISDHSAAQLREMALGLEASGHPFVWAVRDDGGGWVPDGFEERTEGRGLVVRGWAPQILILNHPSVGGFLTHCGWNSSLEGVSAGLPLATWPMFAEQFYNEKLIVDVLKIGVSVGVKDYVTNPEERGLVGATTIKNVADELMGSGEEARERRRRARELGETARRAVEKGGSSHEDMGSLIQELMDKRNARS